MVQILKIKNCKLTVSTLQIESKKKKIQERENIEEYLAWHNDSGMHAR